MGLVQYWGTLTRWFGTHWDPFGPKTADWQTLFFNEINCHSRPSTHYNEQLRSDQFWILFHLLAQASGPQGMVHYPRTLTRQFETHWDPFGPKTRDRQTFFQTRLIATTSPLLSTMNNYNLPNFGSFSNLWPRLVAHRVWYTTQEDLPDDFRPIGTHSGPKEQTDKLFFWARLIATPGPLLTTMDGYDLTNFGFFSNFWPRLVAHRSWYTIQGHLPDDLKPIGTHLGPKERTDKLIFLSEINWQCIFLYKYLIIYWVEQYIFLQNSCISFFFGGFLQGVNLVFTKV